MSTLEGRYRIVGEGTPTPEAIVYAAEDVAHERQVTLIVLRAELAADAEFVAAVREQAFRLGKAACTHPTLARVYECGVTDQGDVFIAVEAVSGRSLREVLAEREVRSAPSAIRLAVQVGEGLEILHRSAVVHGELRPDVIRVVKGEDGSESVKLLGLELTSARRTPRGLGLRDRSLQSYLAPEQLAGEETTEAADVHALGLLLVELLTGVAPRGGKRPRLPRDLPPAVGRIVNKALERRPARRYPDLSLMVNEMWTAENDFDKTPEVAAPASDDAPRTMTRPRPADIGKAAALVAGLLLLGVGAWLVRSDRIAPIFRSDAVETSHAASPSAATQSQASMVTAPEPAVAPPVEAARPEPERPALGEKSAEAHTAVVDTAPVPHPSRDAVAPAVAPAPRPVAKVEAKSPPRRPSKTEADTRPADGDGAAIIDWLLKGRP
jgi:serine/threonine-protein kinase